MTTTTISPFVVGEATEVELSDGQDKKKYWRKEILPSGTRQYKGQTLDFSKINPACVKAFDDGAFDSVPFVLALADNQHPQSGQEAEKLEGDLHKLELSSDGRLFGFFDLSQSDVALKAIQKSNGKFGVSGRIEVDYTASDTGKRYDYALSHVCGTTRPHIKGMSPWESVELSDDEKSRQTIDFSTEVIDDKETSGDGTVTVNLPQETVDFLIQFAKDQKAAEDALNKVTQGSGGDDKSTQLSDSDRKRIELAEENARKGFELAEKAQIELAETRWAARRAELVREGVPPVVLTAAEKVLKSHKRPVIELSEGGKVERIDAASVIEEILDACKGVVKIGQEDGHSLSEGGNSTSRAEYDAFEKEFFENFTA